MWFDGERQPKTIYVANVSRGKDSTAMLRAIQLMGWPLDAIVSVDIWATQDIPAELPPMVEFKEEWDRKCLENFGVPVTRVCATKRERETGGVKMENAIHESSAMKTCFTRETNTEATAENSTDSKASKARGAETSKLSKLTYEDIFYRKVSPQREREREWRRGRNENASLQTLGFPMQRGAWCNSDLKRGAITNLRISRIVNCQESAMVYGRTQRESAGCMDSQPEIARGANQCSREENSTTLFR